MSAKRIMAWKRVLARLEAYEPKRLIAHHYEHGAERCALGVVLPSTARLPVGDLGRSIDYTIDQHDDVRREARRLGLTREQLIDLQRFNDRTVPLWGHDAQTKRYQNVLAYVRQQLATEPSR